MTTRRTSTWGEDLVGVMGAIRSTSRIFFFKKTGMAFCESVNTSMTAEDHKDDNSRQWQK